MNSIDELLPAVAAAAGGLLAVRDLALQAIGVILPVVAPNPVGYLGSALIVGGTFMGTATIAMLAARRVAHTMRMSILAVMTACFGIGQIVGPLVANAMYAPHHSFAGSLEVAAAALALVTIVWATHR